jgi:hypothetical protein
MIAAFLLDSLMDFQEYFRIETTVDARKYYSVIFGLTPKKKDEILFIPSELIEKVEII